MLVLDASCLFEVLIGSPPSQRVQVRLEGDPDVAAPHVVDAEVLGVIRRKHLQGALDATAAQQAVQDLRDWPGERYAHTGLLVRAWQLRNSVQSWDALYVALAELLGATLLTFDARLAAAHGPTCAIEVVPSAT